MDFRLNLITTTISDRTIVTAPDAYEKCLKPFLRVLRKHGNFLYVWKAELQKRGQIHYHVLSNVFMPWQSIRDTWNNLQRKAGYLDGFYHRNKHLIANSTDVHSVQNVDNVAAYVMKYLSKDQKAVICGKTWDCSKVLKTKRFSFSLNGSQSEVMQAYTRKKPENVVQLEHCTIIRGLNPACIFTGVNANDYDLWRFEKTP